MNTPETNNVSRLSQALLAAALTDEYKAAMAAAAKPDATEAQKREVWDTLARVALRDGRSSLAFIDDLPNERIPGFRELNDTLREKVGVVVTMTIDLSTKRVTAMHLDPAGDHPLIEL